MTFKVRRMPKTRTVLGETYDIPGSWTIITLGIGSWIRTWVLG